MILPLRISISGRCRMDMFRNQNVTHILSIDNPNEKTLAPKWFKGHHATVVFQDIDNIKDEKNIYKSNVVVPSVAHVENILQFGKLCLDESNVERVHLLIHCTVGSSRSPAAAFAIICMILGEGNEEKALKILLSIKPDVYPNYLVVKLADTIMNRKGKMLAALRPLREEFAKEVDRWAESLKKQ